MIPVFQVKSMFFLFQSSVLGLISLGIAQGFRHDHLLLECVDLLNKFMHLHNIVVSLLATSSLGSSLTSPSKIFLLLSFRHLRYLIERPNFLLFTGIGKFEVL